MAIAEQNSAPARLDDLEAVEKLSGGMQRSFEPRALSPSQRRKRIYLGPRAKFGIATTIGLLWLGFSAWISLPWIRSLAKVVSLVPAILVVSLLAFVPGFVVAMLAASLLLDRQPGFKIIHPTNPISILIAARNEAAGIEVNRPGTDGDSASLIQG